MATPRNFTGSNIQLGSTKDDSIGLLHVHVDGINSVSRWRLTPEEIAHVNETGDVWVSLVVGKDLQPPLRVSAFPLVDMRDASGQIIGGYDPDKPEIEKPTRIVEAHDIFEM